MWLGIVWKLPAVTVIVVHIVELSWRVAIVSGLVCFLSFHSRLPATSAPQDDDVDDGDYDKEYCGCDWETDDHFHLVTWHVTYTRTLVLGVTNRDLSCHTQASLQTNFFAHLTTASVVAFLTEPEHRIANFPNYVTIPHDVIMTSSYE